MKQKTIVIFFFLSTYILKSQQLDVGKHVFNDEAGISCVINSFNGGKDVAVVLNLGKLHSGRVIKARGEWVKVNIKDVQPNYKGPDGWYHVGDGDCSMDFETPGQQLKIKIHDCENSGVNNTEFKLKRAK